jgi:hypothetical protein
MSSRQAGADGALSGGGAAGLSVVGAPGSGAGLVLEMGVLVGKVC